MDVVADGTSTVANQLINISVLGEWDAEAGIHLIATEKFGLPQASVLDDSEALDIIAEWRRGRLVLDAPGQLPLTLIDASIQGVVRRDVLQFYLSETDRTFDGSPSSWGAQGPLAVELRDGRTVLMDGNHRWAAARIRGKKSFSAQVLRFTNHLSQPQPLNKQDSGRRKHSFTPSEGMKEPDRWM